MDKTVLITGGTGLIGTRLTEILQEKDYKVRYLSRSPDKVKNVEAFAWDIQGQTMDQKALEGTDYIINLAGANVGERWNKEKKKEILESRTRSTALLKDMLRDTDHQVQAFICASAIGYYGFDNGGVLQKEGSRFGDDFLATVIKAWEAEAELIAEQGVRVVKLRTGVVLTPDGGPLERLLPFAKLGLNAPLGSGDQYMSWIHLDDMCYMYIFAMENAIEGVYNAVGPHPVTNQEFTKTTSAVLNKPAFLPNVPSFALKLVFGEMASIILGSNKVASEKIENAGFKFQYPDLKFALNNLLKE